MTKVIKLHTLALKPCSNSQILNIKLSLNCVGCGVLQGFVLGGVVWTDKESEFVLGLNGT